MSRRRTAAEEAWGAPLPDWVDMLVQACDETSQGKVAKRIGRSASVVSQALGNCYAGSLHVLEKRVREVLDAEEITCPALGPISSADCLNWRDRAQTMTSASPISVRMFRECRRCPRFTVAKNGEQT